MSVIRPIRPVFQSWSRLTVQRSISRTLLTKIKRSSYRQAEQRPVKIHPKSFVDLSNHADNSKLNFLSKPHCNSCGIELQEEDPEKPGFYYAVSKDSANSVQKKKEVDLKYDELWKSLSEDEKLELINDTDFSTPKSFKPYSHQTGHELKPKEFKSVIEDGELQKRVNCFRCNQVLHFNKIKLEENEDLSVLELIEKVPSNANIVYVLTARDFPLGLHKEVLKRFKPNKIHYIINKVDHFYDDNKQPFKTGVKYFQKTLARIANADPDKVYLSCGKLYWGAKEILQRLPKGDVYFIGEVNAGKSSLIRSLLYSDNGKLTKKGNYGPGVSAYPSFTKSEMSFPLKSGTNIIDLPGFTSLHQTLTKHMVPRKLREVNMYPVFLSPRALARGSLIRSKIKRVGLYNGKRVMTIDGFFFLRPPPQTVVKFRILLRGKLSVFATIDKAIESYRETRQPALGDIFSLNEKAYEDMEHYVIPPFLGSVDLVIGGLGFVTIMPTSNKSNIPKNELFEVWVPKGIQVCIREPIMKYIYKTKANFDAEGNLLLKDEVATRGVAQLKDVPKNKSIISKVFPVDSNVKHAAEVFADEFYKSEYRHSYKSIELIDPETKLPEEYPNFYWNYKL